MVKPKARFILIMHNRRELSEWVKGLNMSDGYCTNFWNIVNLNDVKLNHMKSHDCYVFIETLLPIAFGTLPDDVWKLLTEISQFFRNFCSTSLEEELLKEMHWNIAISLHMLETIFLLGFFVVIGHLLVYLAEERQLGGPLQYLPIDVSIWKVT